MIQLYVGKKMKKAHCPAHGEYGISMYSLPECPECVKERMTFPFGDDPKHAPTDANTVGSFKSFRSNQISAENIFNYMSTGDCTNPTGCKVYYATGHGSFNAVSLKPCGMIPGSGARNGSGWEAQLAVLQDITGHSEKGPHFSFEEIPHFESRIQNGEWQEAQKCIACNEIYVYQIGTKCPACQQGSGGNG
mgnify:CR=1 FL=1